MNEDKNKKTGLKEFMQKHSSFPFETIFGGLTSSDYKNLQLFGWYVYHKKIENNGRLPLSITPADFIQKLKEDTYNLKSKFGEEAINKATSDFERLIGERRLTADPKNLPAENFLYQFAKSLDDEGVLEDIARGNIVPNYRRVLEETEPMREAVRRGEAKPEAPTIGETEEGGALPTPEAAATESAIPSEFGGGAVFGEGALEAKAEAEAEAEEEEVPPTEKGRDATKIDISKVREEKTEEEEEPREDEFAEKGEAPTGIKAGAVAVAGRTTEEVPERRRVISGMKGGTPIRRMVEQPRVERMREVSEEEMEEKAERQTAEAEEQEEMQRMARLSQEEMAERSGVGRSKKKRPLAVRLVGWGSAGVGGTLILGGLGGSTAKAETICQAENLELMRTILEILIK